MRNIVTCLLALVLLCANTMPVFAAASLEIRMTEEVKTCDTELTLSAEIHNTGDESQDITGKVTFEIYDVDPQIVSLELIPQSLPEGIVPGSFATIQIKVKLVPAWWQQAESVHFSFRAIPAERPEHVGKVTVALEYDPTK
jgi:hypothetical protein